MKAVDRSIVVWHIAHYYPQKAKIDEQQEDPLELVIGGCDLP